MIQKKRATPRSKRCSACPARLAAGEKKCSACGTRRGSKRTSVKARCDRMASAIVKARAGGRCENCGKEAPLDWAHGWPRRHHSLRWETRAAFGLCRPCHQHFTTHPVAWTLWLTARLGSWLTEEFERKANSTWDRNYERVIADLSAQLAELKGRAA